ncbi:MAG: PAS domain S-box protein [Planctomycetota bacterium]|jgi:PAS domain S-box-containing protein
MRDSKSSRKKTIKEVRELRARKPKLERASSDIAERKDAEEELKESEEKYRQIVELAPDGILTVDLKGMITSCNTALLEATGYSKDDFVGRHISKIPTARLRDIPKYIKMFNSLLRGNVPEPFESEWIHKDGTEHWS